jgi:hypothetical protein
MKPTLLTAHLYLVTLFWVAGTVVACVLHFPAVLVVSGMATIIIGLGFLIAGAE